MDGFENESVDKAKKDFLKELKENGCCYEWVMKDYAKWYNAFRNPVDGDDTFYIYERMRVIEEFTITDMMFNNGWDEDEHGNWVKIENADA